MSYYRQRLAAIHARDFTGYARAASAVVVEHVTSGLVVDLGCGSGDLSEAVSAAGLEYLGLDSSSEMVELARARYPRRRFEIGSVYDPPEGAAAIVAVGEVLNYAMDARAGVAGIGQWLRACRAVLPADGLLLFDVAGPLRADPQARTQTFEGTDYRLTVRTQTDPARRLLTRTITIHDEEGDSVEVHELHLIDPAEVMAAARHAGFRITALRHYAPEAPMPRGWSAFLATVAP